jgi:5-methylcytosine-specific restriction protein A
VSEVDSTRLAEILTSRFRVALTGETRRIGGIQCTCVRAADILRPNGFVVKVSAGWRSVEAEFVPDDFAGNLIRSMGQSALARTLFARAATAFASAGSRLTIRVNEATLENYDGLPPPGWGSLELKVRRMSAAGLEGPEAILSDATEVAAACFALILALLPLEEDLTVVDPLFEAGLPEGAMTRVEVNKYERNPVNRAACIARYGTVCGACGFDFGRTYGSIGAGYIEVHHRVPVSQLGTGYIVDPVLDLIPLCANCHAMVHRHDPPMAVEELRTLLLEPRAK